MANSMHATPPATGLPTTVRLIAAWHATKPVRRRQAALAGVASLAVAALTATTVNTVSAVVIGVVGLLAGAAAIVDLHEHRIPNRLLSLALGAVAIGALLGTLFINGQIAGEVLVGLLVAAGPLLIVRYGHGLAMGDVKMAGVLGAAGGLIHPVVGLITVFVAALGSGVFALVHNRKRLALGPWLWAGFGTACAMGIVFVRISGR
jgi:leader peptidase (prepilin peptidase)/N-methyltransferase